VLQSSLTRLDAVVGALLVLERLPPSARSAEIDWEKQTMNRMQAQRLVEQMAIAWVQRDISAIVSLFAEDGALITPGGAARGQAAIASMITTFFAQPVAVAVTITRVLVDGSQGAVEWIWRETSTSGAERTLEDAIIFEVRDGKVVYWREYFDPTQTHEL
jgi:uncharacterized protein (TIGR02246 family)